MHGRLKVRTTAEQQEAKRKERAIKTKKYLGARALIASKREADGVDEDTLMLITKLLTTLPDFGTMWNWRREGFNKLWATMEPAALQKSCERELSFLNGCLEVNPKSYGVWHQRRWTMLNAPTPPWGTELENCNQFLRKDERNFHCWDYRRFVVRHAGTDVVTPDKEFDYTLEKISENFSNYSAWHYRSTLLARVRPGEDGAAIAADALKEEFETVSSAFYIDPCDQSAWFYHRWLLGREDTPPTACAAITERTTTARVVRVLFLQPAYLSPAKIAVTVDGAEVAGAVWSNTVGNPAEASTLWECAIPASPDGPVGSVDVRFDAGGIRNIKMVGQPASAFAVQGAWGDVPTMEYFVSEGELQAGLSRYRIPSRELLEQQLESCHELLQELDAGSETKWTRLALVYIMHGLDPIAHRASILQHLSILASIDTKRAGYYRDITSRYVVEAFVCGKVGAPVRGEVTMAGLGLTEMYCLNHFCMAETLDLSDNRLVRLESAHLLQRLKRLVLDDNALVGVYGGQFAGLAQLAELSLKRNNIRSPRGLSGLTAAVLPALQSVWLEGNPVCAHAEFADCVANLKATVADAGSA